MEIRFITFNSIIHNNLMPWLSENQDEDKFRLLLWKINQLRINASMPFLIALPYAFKEAGITPGQKLTDEWHSFTRISSGPGRKAIQPFLNLEDISPRVCFYSELIVETTAATLALIANLMGEDQSIVLQKHRIMGFMKTISDLIFSARALCPDKIDDGIIINRLLAGLAILYAEIMMHYPTLVEPLLLKVSKSEVRNILKTTSHPDENTRLLYHALYDWYFPQNTPPQSLPPAAEPLQEQDHATASPVAAGTQPETDIDIVKEVLSIQEELSGLKQAVTVAINKKDSLPAAPNKMIGSAEVCRLLHISKSTLKAQREKKVFSYAKIGSRYYYSAKEINDLMKLRK